jgi:hypothetical protein
MGDGHLVSFSSPRSYRALCCPDSSLGTPDTLRYRIELTDTKTYRIGTLDQKDPALVADSP